MFKKKLSIAALVVSGIMLVSGCSQSGGAETRGNLDTPVIESGEKYAVMSVEGFGEMTFKLYPDVAPIGVQNFIDLAESGYYDGKIFHRVMASFMIQGGSPNGDGMGGEAADGGQFANEYNKNMRHFYGALCYANSGMDTNSCQFYVVNKKTYSPVDTTQLQSAIDQLTQLVEQYKGIAEYQVYYDYYAKTKQSYEAMLKAQQEASDEVKAKYEEVGGTADLDGGYTVFGQLVDGSDVLDAISAVEVTTQDSGTETSKPVQTVKITSVQILTK